MTTASVTAYSFVSTLPKDANGFKFLAWARSDSSVAPFTLPKGIGTSQSDAGYLFSHLAIGTHSQASKIEANHPGVALMGVVLDDHNASKVVNGQAQLLKSSHKGELLVTGACKIPIVDATSVNTYTLGSGLLYGGYITGVDVNLGDSVRIENNSDVRINIVFDSTSQTHTLEIPTGGMYFSGSIIHRTNLGANGAASVTLFVERV